MGTTLAPEKFQSMRQEHVQGNVLVVRIRNLYSKWVKWADRWCIIRVVGGDRWKSRGQGNERVCTNTEDSGQSMPTVLPTDICCLGRSDQQEGTKQIHMDPP